MMIKVEAIAPPEKCKLESVHKGLKHSDLIPKVYEGGYKVWECSVDLLQFLMEKNAEINFSGKRVVEMGCGQGLPGIWALLHGAEVYFQDYNKEVLEEATLPCIQHNIQLNGCDASKVMANCKLVSGDWAELMHTLGVKFDYILTSETIYNQANYAALHDFCKAVLKPDGFILLSAKRYYYGVGGGVDSFLDFVEAQKTFGYQMAKVIDDGTSNIRDIIILKFA